VALAPHLVVVRISAFGQDGPYAKRPARQAGRRLRRLLTSPEKRTGPRTTRVTVATTSPGCSPPSACRPLPTRRHPRSKGGAEHRRTATRARQGGRHRRLALRGGCCASSNGRSPLTTAWARCVAAKETACRTRLPRHYRRRGRFVCVVAGSTQLRRLVPGHGSTGPPYRSPVRHPGRQGPSWRRDQRSGRHLDASRTAVEVEEACVRSTCPWPPPTRRWRSPPTPISKPAATSSPSMTPSSEPSGSKRPTRGSWRGGTTPVGALRSRRTTSRCGATCGLTAGELDGLRHRHRVKMNDNEGARSMAKSTSGAESRIALITGASSGIGAALARQLASGE